MFSIKPYKLVICTGRQSDSAYGDLIRGWPDDGCRFVMSDWLNGDGLKQGSLLWVMDVTTSWDLVQLALCCRIPLLVPESNASLKHVCEIAGCGLYFRDSREASACLHLLLTDSALREQMGEKGYAYMKDLVYGFLPITA